MLKRKEQWSLAYRILFFYWTEISVGLLWSVLKLHHVSIVVISLYKRIQYTPPSLYWDTHARAWLNVHKRQSSSIWLHLAVQFSGFEKWTRQFRILLRRKKDTMFYFISDIYTTNCLHVLEHNISLHYVIIIYDNMHYYTLLERKRIGKAKPSLCILYKKEFQIKSEKAATNFNIKGMCSGRH